MKNSTVSSMKGATLCAAAFLMLPLSANAAVAGKFQFVAGGVAVVDGQGKAHPAQKGGEVNEGETLVTETNGAAQIRMVDGGILALRPDTRVTVSAYTYHGKEDGSENAVFSLLRGGLRAITGSIGRTHKENYKITTPSATIGIRGTDHEAIVVLPAQGAAGIAPGTYDKVNVGATTLRTDAGLAVIGPNQVGFASSAAQAPVLLPKIPDIFRASPAPQAHQTQSAPAQSSTQDTSASASNAASSGTSNTGSGDANASVSATAAVTTPAAANLTGVNSSGTSLNTLNQTLTTASGASTSVGAGTVRAVGAVNNWRGSDYVLSASGPTDPNAFRGAVDGGIQLPSQVLEDSSGVIGFFGKAYGYTTLAGTAAPPPTTDADALATIRIGTAVNQDVNSTTLNGVPVTWGRWVGGTVDIYSPDGSQKVGTIDNTNRSVHWVTLGAVSSAFLQIPLTGSATYTLMGNTSPTDLKGNVGTLGQVSLSADFSNARASTTINANFNVPSNTSSWTMTANNIPFSANVDDGFKSTTLQNGVNGITHTVTCTGPSCGQQSIGYVDGHFVMNAQGAVIFYGMASGKLVNQTGPGTATQPVQQAFTPINAINGIVLFKK